MKKLGFVLVLASVLVGGVFGQEEEEPKKGGIKLSAGGLLDLSFAATTNADLKGVYFGLGFDVFFDATYAAVSVGYDGALASYDGTAEDDPTNYLSIGLLGKYPIALGKAFSIAPAVGLEYQLYLSKGDWKRADLPEAGDADNFVLKAGAIADFTITGNLYARVGLLGAFKLAHEDKEDSAFGADVNIGVGYRF
jgi:hypothetical protein